MFVCEQPVYILRTKDNFRSHPYTHTHSFFIVGKAHVTLMCGGQRTTLWLVSAMYLCGGSGA